MPAEELPLMLRTKQVARALGIDRSTLYAWMAQGRFPKPIKLSPRRNVWYWSVVREWLDRQAEQVPA